MSAYARQPATFPFKGGGAVKRRSEIKELVAPYVLRLIH